MKYARMQVGTHELATLLGLPSGITILDLHLEYASLTLSVVLIGEPLPEGCLYVKDAPAREVELQWAGAHPHADIRLREGA